SIAAASSTVTRTFITWCDRTYTDVPQMHRAAANHELTARRMGRPLLRLVRGDAPLRDRSEAFGNCLVDFCEVVGEHLADPTQRRDAQTRWDQAYRCCCSGQPIAREPQLRSPLSRKYLMRVACTPASRPAVKPKRKPLSTSWSARRPMSTHKVQR